MKISQKLPQFLTQKTLLAAVSKQKIALYSAFKGEIKEISRLELPKPRYEDEGLFVSSGKGQTFGVGSVKEIRVENLKQKLLKKLKEELDEIKSKNEKNPFSQIFLFAPSYLISETKTILADKMAPAKIELAIEGNYSNAHPFDLLEKIDQILEEKINQKRQKSISPEAEKILSKSSS